MLRDLCSTCRHIAACCFATVPERPVFHCEEFETGEGEAVAATSLAAGALPVFVLPERPAEEEEAPAAQGLCSDCRHRPRCMYANAEGGVWHCEEYEQHEPDAAAVGRIVKRHRGTRGALIAVLEELQTHFGYLPEAALRAASDGLGHSLVDTYSVATFYRKFSLTPRGNHGICVCQGTACHVRGAPIVAEELERQLGIRRGETTPDREFTLETVNCLGACALGPIVVVDGEYFSNVDTVRAKRIIKEARAGSRDTRLTPAP